MDSINRRPFIIGSSIGFALSALPLSKRNALSKSNNWDLIIIGAGTAGMPTALFALARGAKVLLVEKSPIMGGTMDRSSGQVAAAGTIWQLEKGISDTPQAHYDDVMRINRNTSDPVLTRLLVDNAGDTLNWFAARGYKILEGHPVKGGGHEPFTTKRYQWSPDRALAFYNVMEPMVLNYLKRGKLGLLLDTGAVDLIIDSDGSVGGVVTENDSGERIDYKSHFVVIASGGCAANPRMFEDLHGVPLYRQVAYPYSQGNGISLGLGAGGFVQGGDKYATLFGTILDSEYLPAPNFARPILSPQRRKPWEVFVNVHGKRFVEEDHPSVAHREYSLGLQPGHRHWAIFDQTIFDTAPPFIPSLSNSEIKNAFESHPMFSKASTLRELAVKAGINPFNLNNEINKYNQAIVMQKPDPIGRQHRPLPIANPPFYAIRLQGWNVMSYAGLAVNSNLNVIRADGSLIPNLFAAGEVIGNSATSGNALTNGAGLTPALTFGRLLGQKIIPFSV